MLADLSSEIIIILALILANGFFAGSEIAIVSVKRSRLEARANDGNKAAGQALELSENPDRFLATVQVGITLIGTFSAAFGGARIGRVLTAWFEEIPSLARHAEALALGLVVLSITYLSLILGELLPKRLALQNPERLAIFAAPVMRTLSILAAPLVAFLTLSVNGVFRLVGKQNEGESVVTEEDIVYMIREGTESGTVEAGEAQFIHRIFKFTDRPIYTMMTPRNQIVALPVDIPIREAMNQFITSGYSRLPIYDGTLDQMLGILYIKDMLKHFAGDEQAQELDLKSLLRPANFVVEATHGDDALIQFRQQGIHIALVIDEFGQVTGLITLEDLLEELVGDIRDEYDHEERDAYFQREDGSWLVDALEPYDRVRQMLDLNASKEDEDFNFSSLASLIIEQLGRIPTVGDKIQIENLNLEVMDMDERRVDKVLVSKVEEDQEPTAENG